MKNFIKIPLAFLELLHLDRQRDRYRHGDTRTVFAVSADKTPTILCDQTFDIVVRENSKIHLSTAKIYKFEVPVVEINKL
jgi:hypothetical protein